MGLFGIDFVASQLFRSPNSCPLFPTSVDFTISPSFLFHDEIRPVKQKHSLNFPPFLLALAIEYLLFSRLLVQTLKDPSLR